MSTSARMLSLLSLLQSHRYWPGSELSDRLGVSPRTLRRDIDRLRELGYHVDATRGVAGGYQLRAGSGSMPPLLLADDEAVAIAIGLRSAAAGSIRGIEETAVQALSKVMAMMPPRLSRRLEVLNQATDPVPTFGNSEPMLDAAVLTTVAQAVRDTEMLTFDYSARGAQVGIRRRAEPHRLVTIGRRWYLVAWDRDRLDWRSFRLDRMSEPEPTGARFRPREFPADDAYSFVQQGINAMPMKYAVRVRVQAPAPDVREMVWAHGEVTEIGDNQCLFEYNVEVLQWPAMLLTAIEADYVIESPPELIEYAARAAGRMSAGSKN